MGYREISDLLHRTPSGTPRDRCYLRSLRPARRRPERPPMDAKTPPTHGQNTKSAQLTIGEKNYAFPVYEGTVGPDVIDISKLYGEAGVFTYDPGFTSTGSCESKITYIDGDEGILLYRGYPVGQPFVYPQNNLDYATNFLRMCFAVPAEEYKPNPVLARAMDRIFILHADHEQNASTSTVRLAGSSGANPFACIAAGIACLWGPAHGGANEAALNMLREIGRPERIPEYIARAKDKNDPFRLMGFGHRVYKHYDPRAKIMQKTSKRALPDLGFREDRSPGAPMRPCRTALPNNTSRHRRPTPTPDSN